LYTAAISPSSETVPLRFQREFFSAMVPYVAQFNEAMYVLPALVKKDPAAECQGLEIGNKH
jgi:hypothetical protein